MIRAYARYRKIYRTYIHDVETGVQKSIIGMGGDYTDLNIGPAGGRGATAFLSHERSAWVLLSAILITTSAAMIWTVELQTILRKGIDALTKNESWVAAIDVLKTGVTLLNY